MTPIIGDLISKGADLIRDYFPPDMTTAERLDAERKVKQLEHELIKSAQDYEIAQEAERSKRLASDMTSDSWLSKNVRPLVLVYLMGAWTVFAGFSMFGGMVDGAYVDMLKDMLMAAFGFYFVSRGAEKITAIVKGGKA